MDVPMYKLYSQALPILPIDCSDTTQNIASNVKEAIASIKALPDTIMSLRSEFLVSNLLHKSHNFSFSTPREKISSINHLLECPSYIWSSDSEMRELEEDSIYQYKGIVEKMKHDHLWERRRVLTELQVRLQYKKSDPMLKDLVFNCIKNFDDIYSNDVGSIILGNEFRMLKEFATKRIMRRKVNADFNLLEFIKQQSKLINTEVEAKYLGIADTGVNLVDRSVRTRAIITYIKKKSKRLLQPKIRYTKRQKVALERPRVSGRFLSKILKDNAKKLSDNN